jgi:murein L,D-transpeptidase YafK
VVRQALLVALTSCTSAAPPQPVEPSPISCPRGAAAIVVETSDHRMALCEAGKPTRTFRVAIGRGGVDKQRQGDRKTPLGSYALTAPSRSSRFRTFIPIDYPTPAQRAEGRTGGAVGIHGPLHHPFFGVVRSSNDWTDGCIAMADDDAIDQVAAWTVARHARRIILR